MHEESGNSPCVVKNDGGRILVEYEDEDICSIRGAKQW